jgi:hypothetical protein
MRNEIASSVEMAECNFTGMRTRLRRRLPDQRDAGMDATLRRYERVGIWLPVSVTQGEQNQSLSD